MSYLIRTGTGRTNISWSTVTNTSTRYLRRTSTGRNNIVWTTIPSGSTYNILNRTGTGRNNIAWGNLKIGPDLSATALQNNMHLTTITMTDSAGYEFDTWCTGYTRYDASTGRVTHTGYNASSFYTCSDKKISINNVTSSYLMNGIPPNNSDIWKQHLSGYLCVFVFCSQSPPSDYLNAIKTVTTSTGGPYNVRYVQYGLKWYYNYSNVLVISLNTQSKGTGFIREINFA